GPPRDYSRFTDARKRAFAVAGTRCGDPALGPGFPLEFTPAKAGAGMSGGCSAVDGVSLKLKHCPVCLDDRRQRAAPTRGVVTLRDASGSVDFAGRPYQGRPQDWS